MFYPDIVGRTRKAQGGIAQMLGIDPEDLEWAKSLGKKYGEAEELDGRGDAARHLALGWLAKKSNYPSLTKFAINAREALELDFKGGHMDVENNKRGFNLPAADRQEAEQQIMDMISSGDATFFTPQESRQRRGYVEGGNVEDEEDGFFDRLSEAFVKKVFGDGSVKDEIDSGRGKQFAEERDLGVIGQGINDTLENLKYVTKPVQALTEATTGPLLDAVSEYAVEESKEYLSDLERNRNLLDTGKITTTERDIRAAGKTIDLAMAPINDLVDETIQYIPYFEEAAQYISETEAAQALAKLAAENPRVTEDIIAITQILGVIPAVKLFERGINRIASSVNTDIKGFYGPGATSAKKVALAGKAFVTRVPSSVTEALGPGYNAVRRSTGLAPTKIKTAVTALDKGDSKSATNAMAELLTGRYIGLQSREKGGLIHDKNPIVMAHEYNYDEAFDPTSFKKNVFASVKEGGNVNKAVPNQVQEDAIQHMFNSWDIPNPEETFFVYKRPDGPQKLGDEVFSQGFDDGAPSLKKIMGKEKKHTTDDPEGKYKKGDVYQKSGKDRMLEFYNNERLAEGKKPVSSLRSMPPETFKKYLDSNKIKYTEGPDDFIYIGESYVSNAKEIGGVNVFSAIDTKTGDVFAMVSDKHDIFKDIDPIFGRSLMTVQPMIGMNFKTGKSLGYKERDYKAEAQEAKNLFNKYSQATMKSKGSKGARELGEKYFKDRMAKLNKLIAGDYKNTSFNEPIAATIKILEYVKDNPEVAAQDLKDLSRRAGIVTGASPVLVGQNED